MARSKAPKNLEVDGTAKLAAKAKPSDKHEKPDLNIEEATVASPRPSRKRAGDYFDFDGEDTADGEEPSGKVVPPKKAKPSKKTKTAAAGKDEKANRDKEKPAAKEKKSRGAKDSAAIAPKEKVTEVVGEKKEKKTKASKEDVPTKDKAEISKKSKVSSKEPVTEEKPTNETGSKAAAAEPKSKPKKSKVASKEDDLPQESSTIAPDVAMDEGPFESLLGSEKGKGPENAAGKPAEGAKSSKGGKPSKKPAKEPKATIDTVAEKATDATDAVKEGAKTGVEKTKKAAKGKASATETAAEIADTLKKETKAGGEKVKKVAKAKAPTTETAAEVADSVRKEAKAGAEKVKKVVKPKEDGKPPKKDQASKPKGIVKKTASTDEQSKPEGSKSKKRKASAGDAETVKADILDPLSEHAEASAKKKQKKEKAKSKSLGDAVGDLISSAAEGATAAVASLEGFASSFMGGAPEVAESAGDVKKPAKSAAKKAKGKGKAIAEDLAESSGKAAATEVSDHDTEDDFDAEPDDHTAALLAGFESEGDDAHGSGPGFEQGQAIPKLPDAKETAKKLKDVKADANDGPGVVYVGRIPHGFYEHEMRKYFSQFGDISRLRLSRNRKTGASRHWAFIEFKSVGVAKIVADTMDTYLMFGHILKCKVVPKEQLHENVWKGANKRFKTIPFNKLEGRKHEVPVGRAQWNARNENEEKRRVSKSEKMKEIGYEFEAPPLKGVDEVPVRDIVKKSESGETFEEEKSLVTTGDVEGSGTMVVSEEVKIKKTKKSAKGEPKETTTTVVKKTKRALEAGEEAAGSMAKKAKKAKGAVAEA